MAHLFRILLSWRLGLGDKQRGAGFRPVIGLNPCGEHPGFEQPGKRLALARVRTRLSIGLRFLLSIALNMRFSSLADGSGAPAAAR